MSEGAGGPGIREAVKQSSCIAWGLAAAFPSHLRLHSRVTAGCSRRGPSPYLPLPSPPPRPCRPEASHQLASVEGGVGKMSPSTLPCPPRSALTCPTLPSHQLASVEGGVGKIPPLPPQSGRKCIQHLPGNLREKKHKHHTARPTRCNRLKHRHHHRI